MKSVNAVSAMAGLVCLAAAGAAVAVTPPNPKDLTQGSWELQLDKSHFNCGTAPKKSHREIFEAGWGLMSVYWTGMSATGKPFDIRYVYNYNGDKYPEGIPGPANEAITYKLVNASRVDFWHWDKNDKMTQALSRVISSDGQTMTQTTKYLSWKGGKECIDTQIFARQ